MADKRPWVTPVENITTNVEKELYVEPVVSNWMGILGLKFNMSKGTFDMIEKEAPKDSSKPKPTKSDTPEKSQNTTSSNKPKKDNTILFVIIGIVVLVALYLMFKKK